MLTRLLSLLTLLALVAAAPASAGKPRSAKFTASFEGTVTTTWDIPKFKLSANCFRTNWMEGRGSEVWKVKSKGVTKVLASDNGVATQLQFGSHERNADSGQGGLAAAGFLTREGGTKTSFTPGTCGEGESGYDPARPNDCGTRLPKYEVGITVHKGEATPEVMLNGNGLREKVRFETCQLFPPRNVLEGSWPAVSGKLKKSALYGTAKTLTVKADESWTDTPTLHGKGAKVTTSTKVSWRLVLTRVKKR